MRNLPWKEDDSFLLATIFSQKGSLNSCLSSCAPRQLCASSSDAWNQLISFFNIWHNDTKKKIKRIKKKLVRTEFWSKLCFTQKWIKWTRNRTQMMRFFLPFLKNFIFLGNLNEKYLYLTASPLSGKILVFKLCA